MPPDEEAIAFLSQTRDEFTRALEQVRDEDLTRSTPCEGWTVKDVIDHVLRSEAAVRPWLDQAEKSLDADLPQGPPQEVWKLLVDEADAALQAPGAFDLPVQHPVIGPMNGALLAEFRIVDRIVHAWDVLVAIGADDTLNHDLVERVYERALPAAELISAMPVFEAPPEVEESADVQTRFLALFGRRRDRAAS